MSGVKGRSGGARPGSGPKGRSVPGAEKARKRLWAAIDKDAKENAGDIFELLVGDIRDGDGYRDKVGPAWRIVAAILVKGDTSRTEISIESKRAAIPIILPFEQAKPTPPAEVIKLKK